VSFKVNFLVTHAHSLIIDTYRFKILNRIFDHIGYYNVIVCLSMSTNSYFMPFSKSISRINTF